MHRCTDAQKNKGLCPQFSIQNSRSTSKAFTLAEMMVVLLVLSLVMAAFLPVITKKTKTPTGIWQYAANNADAYFGLGATQGIAIGANGLETNLARLYVKNSSNLTSGITINTVTKSPIQNHMIFQQDGTQVGILTIDKKHNLGLGSVNLPSTESNSLAIGYGADASGGDGSTALGYTAIANGGATVALGYNTRATGAAGTAVGYWAQATTNSTALGYDAQANPAAPSGNAVSIGMSSRANANSANAIGNAANASGSGSIAIGCYNDANVNTKAIGTYSIAMGAGVEANSYQSVAIGYAAQVVGLGVGSMVFGSNSMANADVNTHDLLSVGNNALTHGDRSIAIGSWANASGDNTINIGYNDGNSHTAGYGATALEAIAIGHNSRALSKNSMAVGLGAYAKGGTSYNQDASAFGDGATANNDYAIALGSGAQAQSFGSVALGTAANAQAGYTYPIAIGYYAHANKDRAIAIGGWDGSTVYTKADGFSAIAMGYIAQATSDYAIAIGSEALASNIRAIAIGEYSKTTGNRSTAVGTHAWATGDYSTAIGYYANAEAPGSVAIGTDDTGAAAHALPGWTNQFVLGTTNHNVFVPGHFQIGYSNAASISAASGVLSISSDKRLKNVTSDFAEGLNKIRQIQPYNFTFKADKEKIPHVGVIAQDLQKVFPDAVTKNDKGFLAIRQDDMFYAMLNSIKQLDKILQGLVNDFKVLVARVQKLDDKVEGVIKAVQINAKEIQALKSKNAQLEARIKKLEKHTSLRGKS